MLQIYHYMDGTSDKIWAINTQPISVGEYEVFYGRRTNKLTRRLIKLTDPFNKIREKERSGYQQVFGRLEAESGNGIRYIDGPPVQNSQPDPQPISNPKPKKRPKQIVDLSTIESDTPTAFF